MPSNGNTLERCAILIRCNGLATLVDGFHEIHSEQCEIINIGFLNLLILML